MSYDSKSVFSWVNMFFFTPMATPNFGLFYVESFVIDYSCVCRGLIFSPFLFPWWSSCVGSFCPYPEFLTQILHWVDLVFCAGSGTFPLQKIPASATEQISFGRSRLTFLEQVWQFLDVVHPPTLHQIQLLGFGTSLNSIVATPSQHSVHYQFFNCRKGLIKRTPFPTPRQFGTFSLWRKLRWASTPNPIRQALCSRTFHNRVDLWEII